MNERDDGAAFERVVGSAISQSDRARYVDLAESARREWPTVSVPAEVFAAWVVDRLPKDTPIEAALATLRISDLYLTCGCALAQPSALSAFEATFFGEVDAAAKRVQRSAVQAEELRQIVRERLFVASDGPARIAKYGGTGNVRAWLRVTATRIALNLATRGPREQPREAEALAAIAATDDSAEVHLLKTKYGAELRAAFVEGTRLLDAEDKTFLLHAYVDGLSIDRVAAMYGIHRATAARRVERARRALLDATTSALSARLGGCSPTEAKSIMNLAKSQFDITLGSLLREDDRR